MRAGTYGPAERQENQNVDGGVLKEIDAVGEQRYRANGERYAELDAEIGQVECGDDKHSATECDIVRISLHDAKHNPPAGRTASEAAAWRNRR